MSNEFLNDVSLVPYPPKSASHHIPACVPRLCISREQRGNCDSQQQLSLYSRTVHDF